MRAVKPFLGTKAACVCYVVEYIKSIVYMSYYAVYQTASGEFSWCRIPSNITVFSAVYRYASRVAGSDKQNLS